MWLVIITIYLKKVKYDPRLPATYALMHLNLSKIGVHQYVFTYVMSRVGSRYIQLPIYVTSSLNNMPRQVVTALIMPWNMLQNDTFCMA